eukprot:279435-Amorphochlora_amoeboformis.AAC.2
MSASHWETAAQREPSCSEAGDSKERFKSILRASARLQLAVRLSFFASLSKHDAMGESILLLTDMDRPSALLTHAISTRELARRNEKFKYMAIG